MGLNDQFAGDECCRARDFRVFTGVSSTTRVSNDNSVRPVSADAWGWRSPNPPGISRRFLISDCQIPECICRMARPIVFWAQTDTALLVLTLVVIAKRIASSFSRRVIKPTSRKHAPRSFYAHHRGTGSGILDRSAALEAGFSPVIDVTLAGDVVRRHAIVRQVDDHIVPAAPAQLVC